MHPHLAHSTSKRTRCAQCSRRERSRQTLLKQDWTPSTVNGPRCYLAMRGDSAGMELTSFASFHGARSSIAPPSGASAQRLPSPLNGQEARALVAELLGGQVKVRKEGDAVYARLELDANVLLAKAANSSKSKDFQFGSGACSRLIVRRSSTFPISIAAKSGERISQAIVAGDTR